MKWTRKPWKLKCEKFFFRLYFETKGTVVVYESVYTVDFGEQCGWSFNGGITKKN